MTITNQIKKFIGNVKNYTRFLLLSNRTETETKTIIPEKEVHSNPVLKNEFKEYAYIDTSKLRELLKSMEEIKEKNNTIFKLIKIIDDLTYQTNLLAINNTAEASEIAEMRGNTEDEMAFSFSKNYI